MSRLTFSDNADACKAALVASCLASQQMMSSQAAGYIDEQFSLKDLIQEPEPNLSELLATIPERDAVNAISESFARAGVLDYDGLEGGAAVNVAQEQIERGGIV